MVDRAFQYNPLLLIISDFNEVYLKSESVFQLIDNLSTLFNTVHNKNAFCLSDTINF